MAASKQALKGRIASVESTKKITNAMQLVASSKLNKARNHMEKNREYADSLQELLSIVLDAADPNSRFLKEDDSKPSYVFAITSDMGLCGAYNANVYRALVHDLKDTDYLTVIGSRGASWAKAKDIPVQETLIDVNEDDAYERLSACVDKALRLYQDGKIGAIKVLYTRYKNTLTFEPTLMNLLPLNSRSRNRKNV